MTTPEDALKAYLRHTLATYDYLNQDEIWIPKPPRKRVRITNMDPEWRYNSAQMLLRNAAVHADRYSWGEIASVDAAGLSEDNAMDIGDDMADWDAERMADPQAWMKTTHLYRALVAGLPTKPSELRRLAERARHWSTCPARRSNANPCQCEAIRTAQPAAVVAAPPQAVAPTRPVPVVEQPTLPAVEPIDRNIDPSTGREWGIDEVGFNHKQPHAPNDYCHFDSCSNCFGYHCDGYCPEVNS